MNVVLVIVLAVIAVILFAVGLGTIMDRMGKR